MWTQEVSVKAIGEIFVLKPSQTLQSGANPDLA